MKLLNNAIIILSILLSVNTFAQIKLPKLISNGMVLQRNENVKIWGWAEDGENISVNFIDSTYHTTADINGNWNIILPKLNAGGPYNMDISSDDTITIKDIMIGEVWIGSGQSNMEITMERVSPLYGKEIAECYNTDIRYFEVPDAFNFNSPQKDFSSGRWVKTDHETILKYSAVCYFFGKELYNKYKVPVGLINAALGGSPIECWLSEDQLKKFPEHYEEALKFKDSTLIEKIRREDKTRIDEWYGRQYRNDKGFKNTDTSWYSPDFIPDNWDKMNIPGFWADEKLGFVNGVVWFRKEFDVPSSMIGKKAKLVLGTIVNADSVFVNGTFVGTTSYQYPPRRYDIPENILIPGKNLIVIRVINTAGRGGFTKQKQYEITVDNNTINLSGEWEYKLGVKMEMLRGQTFIRWKPLGLYNAMIAPLLKYRMKGVLWYQGESNAGRPIEYRELFPALITDWRKNWGQGDFPFLFVQLPNFMKSYDEPTNSNWALMREAQEMALSKPNTGMAVAIDIGEWNDIHPLNKKDVGRRLFLAADKIAYGNDSTVFSGPIYKSMLIEDNKIILSFNNTGKGLATSDNKSVKRIAVAGADKHYIWAESKIEGDKLIVWSNKIPHPIAVRYAWSDNPEGANLINTSGLPASPFRTDNWD